MFIAGIELFFGFLAGCVILFVGMTAVIAPYQIVRGICSKRTAQ